MARIRLRPIPWADKYDEDNYKDYRRGALDDAFWDEDELVDYVSQKKKPRKKKKRGCPDNDFGPHVYVWVTEKHISVWGGAKAKIYTVDSKKCCGCLKVAKRNYHW